MSVKAFELVPAIERVKLMSDKAKTEIECLECCGKNLYLGTNDCFVVHYIVEEKATPNGKTSYQCAKQGHKYLGVHFLPYFDPDRILGHLISILRHPKLIEVASSYFAYCTYMKKPVLQLKAASALNRIMVLCDNTLTLLNMFDLEPILGGAKIKGVVSFCINENPSSGNPFSVEICVALKKKMLQIYNVTEDRMMHIKDVPTVEPPITMSLDGNHICVAMTTQYNLVDYETNHRFDLFPYESDLTTPLVKRIAKEEFLLSGPSALGMFVTTAGISQRPPLPWNDNLISISYSHPYILALNDEFITVHSILDQQQKQTIPFQGGKYLGDFDGRIFVASSKDIYSLVPVAWEKQTHALLADKRVAEALELAKNAKRTGITKEKFLKIYKRIQQQAGFIEFSQQNFDEARELFRNGQVDVRELIHVYPLLMPASTNFTRSVPLLHDIADINQLAKLDRTVIRQYKDFLISYLEEIRNTRDAVGCMTEVDTALLKLYSEVNSPELVTLIASESACDIKDSVDTLKKYERFHPLGLLFKFHGEHDKALHIWTRIANGDIVDESFPGLEFVVEYLANLSDHELVWKYVDWALEKDEDLAVKIFTERPSEEPVTERMRPDTVVDYLHRYPKAVITYLEYLVFQKKLEKEKFHTHLAVLYLDAVLQLMKNPQTPREDVEAARMNLRHMLQTSSLYRVQLLIGKVRETEMHAECAILYAKLEEHDKALRILVHKLKDYSAAENYCMVNSKGKDSSYRKRLFHILLSVYLDPSNERRDSLIAPAVSLLNTNQGDFELAKVLQIIPDNWSIGLLSQFLLRSTRRSLHNTRTTHIERMMSRGHNLQLKQTSVVTNREPIFMTESRQCAVCNRTFNEPTFVRYPNGIITHLHCARNKNVCPITGKLFSTTK